MSDKIHLGILFHADMAEAQGEDRHPLAQERRLRDRRRGGAAQPLQAQQDRSGLPQPQRRGAENPWDGEMRGCYDI